MEVRLNDGTLVADLITTGYIANLVGSQVQIGTAGETQLTSRVASEWVNQMDGENAIQVLYLALEPNVTYAALPPGGVNREQAVARRATFTINRTIDPYPFPLTWRRERDATMQATKTARALLLRHLLPSQRKTYRRLGGFLVVGSLGGVYWVWAGRPQAVLVARSHPNTLYRLTDYCIGPRSQNLPTADIMLAQKLFIETDEAAWRRKANAFPRGIQPIPVETDIFLSLLRQIRLYRRMGRPTARTREWRTAQRELAARAKVSSAASRLEQVVTNLPATF